MKRLMQICMLLAGFHLAGCDKLSPPSDRYSLSKDSSGQTIRLDKRTGEVAVIQGNEIRPLKDAATATAERVARSKDLEQLKSWPGIDLRSIAARANISTAWRGGKMLYVLTLSDLAESKAIEAWLALPKDQRTTTTFPTANPKKKEDVLRKTLLHSPFTVQFEDENGFQLSSFVIPGITLTRIVDDKGATQYLERKSSIDLPEDDYGRLKHWNIHWH